jgi:hypothetical protein
METKSLNIGTNRGKRRVWVEGKALERLGWVKGVTYTRKPLLLSSGFTLTRDNAGDLRVAGGDGRPVLDLCGNYVAAALEGFDKVTVTITAKKITITGKAAALLLPVLVKALEVAA